MTNSGAPPSGACPGTTHEGVDAMGRGRQKAKQTKVARQLKYSSPETDYEALARELHGESGRGSSADDRTDGFGDDLDEEPDDYDSAGAHYGPESYDDWVAQGESRR